MQARRVVPLGVWLLSIAAGEISAQTAADSASVTALYGEWFTSMRQGPERYASFYATDGMVLPPNAGPAVGRTAITEWMRQAQAAMPYTVRPEGISVDEMRFLAPAWVLYRSTLRGQRIPKAGGEPVPFETKYGRSAAANRGRTLGSSIPHVERQSVSACDLTSVLARSAAAPA